MSEKPEQNPDQGQKPQKLGEGALTDWLKLGLEELQQAVVLTPQQDFMGRPLSQDRGLGR
jgi:hypothetical protein